MYLKKLRRIAVAILCLVNLNIFAAQYISEAAASELSKTRPADMGSEYANSLKHVMQQSPMKDSNAEDKSISNPGLKKKADQQSSTGWNAKFQPYVDAHRKFWAS
jgi:hypothetical protein